MKKVENETLRIEDQEMTEAQKKAICYKSTLLNKYFDTYEELVEAETEFNRIEEEKRLAAEAKKAEANKVEEAYKELNAAKSMYNQRIVAAKKAYLEEVAAAKEKYADIVEASEKLIEEAQVAYTKALDEFTKKHPEGFHMTLKDGDNVTTISRSGSTVSDAWNDFFKSVVNLF